MNASLVHLFWLFVVLSLLAFGGGAGIVPDMERAAVETYHWMTAKEFLDFFAIARAVPGPGSMIAVLVGMRVDGLAGAMVSFVAMFAPSCVIVHFVAKGWSRAARKPWRAVVEDALAPVAIGMTFASGLALARANDSGPMSIVVTVASTLAFAFTSINPLWLLAAGAAALLAVGA